MSSSETDGSDASQKSDSTDVDEDGEFAMEILRHHQALQATAFSVACLLGQYFMTYYDKNKPRTSQLSGYAWVLETLRTPGESHHMFRMNSELFCRLHDLLVSTYDLKSTNHMNSIESVAIFLFILGGGESNRRVQNRFKHSGETISRKFEEVLFSVVSMCKDYICPKDPNFRRAHSRIKNDKRMWPHFKNCIGAIDGTHVAVNPPREEYVRYIGRHKSSTQNVMAAVDFDMRFTYASIGQPGSMHDTSVLYHALEVDKDIFPHPPQDAGYPNRPGYMSPYKGQRYHVPEWRNGPPPSGEQEYFNQCHSSARNVVERTFGVWKMKWRILLKMPTYPMDKQEMIIASTMCLHNFIRQNCTSHKYFRRCDRDLDYVPTIPARYAKYVVSQNASDTSTTHSSDRSMDIFRDNLASTLCQSR
ncbi:protein ALP1-like isoform X2 [Oryza brachyantha]|uniref:protein ALP1-like isoform X2 n=1 Tax=Oryza brachyantha TaxID=4533 RepID=UPI001AD9BB26|nr:protein ALP1-like isoform X2 [Oryza brachyantha]